MEPGALICVRCGASFRCGNVAGDPTCWCAELPPVMPLDAAATSCFCPACLREEVARRVAAEPSADEE